MRLLVFFDLPMETAAQRKVYRQFRKFLIKDGFLMQQKSVYSKMVLDAQVAEAVMARLRKNKPKYGLVQVLKVTEKQFAAIESIAGEAITHNEIDSEEKLIIL
jgi:CRISPR-associated protein Cas2